jgi:hypothetical protein
VIVMRRVTSFKKNYLSKVSPVKKKLPYSSFISHEFFSNLACGLNI